MGHFDNRIDREQARHEARVPRELPRALPTIIGLSTGMGPVEQMVPLVRRPGEAVARPYPSLARMLFISS